MENKTELTEDKITDLLSKAIEKYMQNQITKLNDNEDIPQYIG